MLEKWPKRDEGPNSYCVPAEEIQRNGWSLASSQYKQTIAMAANHDAPEDILGDILKIEEKIVDLGGSLLVKISKKK